MRVLGCAGGQHAFGMGCHVAALGGEGIALLEQDLSARANQDRAERIARAGGDGDRGAHHISSSSREEGAACEAASIPWEIVPGVTAASAAAAEIGGFLTERGAYDSLVLTTGASRPGDPAPDWASLVRPGTTLALYMAVSTAPEIRAALLAGGAPPTSAVEIIAEAGSTRAKSWRTSLAALADMVAREPITNPAMILVRLPKASAAVRLRSA